MHRVQCCREDVGRNLSLDEVISEIFMSFITHKVSHLSFACSGNNGVCPELGVGSLVGVGKAYAKSVAV